MNSNRTRRQSRPNSNGLAYDSLESRCVLTGSHQVFVPLPEELNLVQNEAFHTAQESVSGLYTTRDIAGWRPIQSGNPIRIEGFPGRGQVLNLDSSTGLDQVYQDIPTEPGKKYLISFDSRPSSLVYQQGHPVVSTKFAVYWNGSQIATIQPRYHWKTNTLEVYGGNGDFSRLKFSEIQSGSVDRVGALVNHIRVVNATKFELLNGGFEKVNDSTLTRRAYTYLNGNGNVPGWTTTAPPNYRAVIMIEPRFPNIKEPRKGGTVLNLNANAGFIDSVSQDLATVPGELYYVRFSARGNAINELRVSWNNDWALSVRPDVNWESIGLLVQASSLSTNLRFIEGATTNGDIRIDNVEIHRVDRQDLGSRPAQQPPTANFSAYASFPSDTTIKKRKL